MSHADEQGVEVIGVTASILMVVGGLVVAITPALIQVALLIMQ